MTDKKHLGVKENRIGSFSVDPNEKQTFKGLERVIFNIRSQQ